MMDMNRRLTPNNESAPGDPVNTGRQAADSSLTPPIPAEWLEEFKAAAGRSLETRMRYAFIRTYKPVLDDAPYRAFDSMEAYRQWCERNLPDWLGYGRV